MPTPKLRSIWFYKFHRPFSLFSSVLPRKMFRNFSFSFQVEKWKQRIVAGRRGSGCLANKLVTGKCWYQVRCSCGEFVCDDQFWQMMTSAEVLYHGSVSQWGLFNTFLVKKLYTSFSASTVSFENQTIPKCYFCTVIMSITALLHFLNM